MTVSGGGTRSGLSVNRCPQAAQGKTDCGGWVGRGEWKPQETREEGTAGGR